MKKCCFIIPYFGKLPNYFEVFAKSCEKKLDYQWLVFTDDEHRYQVPKNVVLKSMSFNEFLNITKNKLGFEPEIQEYHKICDLKPAFGYIFEDYIKEFEFWGYCDLDTIFGDMNAFITDDILRKYDKLFCLGHCVMFKNNYENNRMFMKPVNGKIWYRESFLSPKTTVFDETYGGTHNINTLFKFYNKKVLEEDWSFNCNIAPANLQRIRYVPESNSFKVEKYHDSIFVWDNGKILRYQLKKGKIYSEEYMYMHFQQRKMKVDKKVLQTSAIKILGDGFYSMDEEKVTVSNFKKIKHRVYSFRKFKLLLKWKKDGLKKKLGI
ncbi:hypothetical protein lacNasYZ03_18120 [Lactobacillus nasalidis]|uniref:Glycosyl transferase n=1 Tax=Lactobacillus nasalidis TaxID=2797258 RepID=A0ABQ3W9L9_9LACO|nr:DUF6625 family protein [Lactobacillus nasalidis]GHV98054.1 hypothetical protein lacNasYZ01_12360 [Lactobacillus nasalidis]GHV99693.1 hypothetical protein lacNasYZ02_11230 [Lactobacillus nasalidis]GHW02125.1 hypothetical protein lacNasYZ03_18120 [Lactobacillus nasalidis]